MTEIKGDLISRKDLREAIFYHDYTPVVVDDAVNDAVMEVLRLIDNAPTVDAIVRPHGEYIRVDRLWLKCSICGNLTRDIKKYNMPNFCPACGADMRGKQNE